MMLPGRSTAGRLALLAVTVLAVIQLLALRAGTASAQAQAPWWRLSSDSAPTVLRPGDTEDLLFATATDIGDADADGSKTPITIIDKLPAGLTPTAIRLVSSDKHEEGTCEPLPALRCSFAKDVEPYVRLELKITVEATAGMPAGQIQNELKIEGGQAPSASLSRALTVANEPTSFGAHDVEVAPENEAGSRDTQAGSHPFQMTTTFDFNQTLEDVEGQPRPSAPALLKDLHFDLPAGLIGDPQATPQCSALDFSTLFENATNLCPSDTAVGAALVTLTEPASAGFLTVAVPLFNLAPAPDEPARFGFEALSVPVVLDTQVRTGGDYSVQVNVRDATSAAQVLGSQVTFWGEPGDPRHDQSRGWPCILGGSDAPEGETCEAPSPRPTTPFLTLPTSCEGPLTATLTGDSWSGETLAGAASIPALGGCSELAFEPTIEARPETQQASTPTGLSVSVRTPQTGLLEEKGLAPADIRDTMVTLPAGLELSPAAASSLEACSEQQIGFTRYEPQQQIDEFTPAQSSCPEASKVGLVHIKTPLLAHELQGAVYLATPAPSGETGKNPFNSLVALYLVAEEPVSKVLVKLAGEVTLNESTLQASTTFKNTPQVPFEELRLELFGGPRGTLSTPAFCGSYASEALFAPWSGSEGPGGAISGSVTSDAGFAITSGPGGEGCPAGALPFAPGFNAQSASTTAGALTSFSLNVARPDGNQALQKVTTVLPAGIGALLSSVTPCGEPQASQGACGPESLIGHTNVQAGLGPEPVTPPEGDVYITGPYHGAPFGLSIVAPAVAGPFNLGNVVVRAAINVNPHTAQVSVTSEPLPTQLKGVPLQLKQVHVQIDRSAFEYNPTSCEPMKIEGSLTGSQGAGVNVSSPFQVQGCKNLPFKPGVTASTQGTTSKANGAALELTFKSTGGEAHVAKTILTIPAILPARLTTIQKACLASVFEANPASCPEGSDIGTATVHTPVLKSPLTGPIYLVSHGNAAWPDAELVLQSEGITVVLDGQTAIKKGVTTSSFQTVPDAPFQSVQATLSEGPHSALTTNLPLKDHYSLCGQSLTIPTALTGQNGTLVNDNVKVTVAGCHTPKTTRTKKLTRAQVLAKALKACRKAHAHSRAERTRCVRQARRR
jgi:hypothetical protein